ncbi:MAG: hypothetical protein J6B56_05725 [Clostridia bacterium]|nr:hypothetical protein [Clostridia bacterium]
MKKIGLWMAALTAVTVGGVYATWNYAENNNIAKVIQEKSIALAPAHQKGESGSYSVVTSDDFGMWIESSGSMSPTATNKHNPVFVMSGKITIYFTASANASQQIRENGLTTKFDFSLNLGGSSAWTCDPNFEDDDDATNDTYQFVQSVVAHETTIYPVGTTGDNVVATWKRESAGVFSYVIDTNVTRTVNPDKTYVLDIPSDPSEGEAKYQDVITFENFTLDTYAKYEYFRDVALDGKMVVLSINDTTGQAEAQKA